MPSLPPRFKARDSAARASTVQRGYDADWKRTRRAFLIEHPLCRHHQERGEDRIAEEVDHIVPIRTGGGRLDWSNLQPLCKACHSRKTMRELSGR